METITFEENQFSMSLSISVVAFDLDGTILNDQKKVSVTDYKTLVELGEKGILRVAATGRNHFSVYRVLSVGFPVDYVVFSSGAGIMDWKTGEILFTCHLAPLQLKQVIQIIEPHHLSFTVHQPIPNTHWISYCKNGQTDDDLYQYANHYHPVVNHFHPEHIREKATQMIIQFHTNEILFHLVSQQLAFVKTIRTTSPINHQSLWMEILDRQVSKANGLRWLCNYLGKNENKILSIGNDFNDSDMLNFTAYSFVVANAPEPLKQKYQVTASNKEDGLSKAVKLAFK
jgi:Cof subfamily protein (haloacid dehalogenase superfamily)